MERFFDSDKVMLLYLNALKKVIDDPSVIATIKNQLLEPFGGHFPDLKNSNDSSAAHNLLHKMHYNSKFRRVFLKAGGTRTEQPNVIFDITGRRMNAIFDAISIAQQFNYKVCVVWVVANPDEASANNNDRDRKVDDDFLRNAHKQVFNNIQHIMQDSISKQINSFWIAFNSKKIKTSDNTVIPLKKLKSGKFELPKKLMQKIVTHRNNIDYSADQFNKSVAASNVVDSMFSLLAGRTREYHQLNDALLAKLSSDYSQSFSILLNIMKMFKNRPEDEQIIKTFSRYLHGASIGVSTFLYRGSHGNSEIFEINPSESNRMSKDNGNFYNAFTSDVSQAWSVLPARSRSLICSTSKRYTDNFGEPHFVLPHNSATFGICSEYDIWECFDKFRHIIDCDKGNTAETLTDFAHIVIEEFTGVNLIDATNHDEYTRNLEHALHKKISYDELNTEINLEHLKKTASSILSGDSQKICDLIDNIFNSLVKDKTLYDFFEWLLNPKENGVFVVDSLHEVGKIKYESNGHEVWFSAPAIMIPANSNIMDDLYELVNSKGMI